MNKKLFYILSIIPTLFLASCGYGLKQIYDGNLYNSPIWENNYYRTYEQGSDVISSKDEMINDGHLPFTSFSDPNFLLEEPNFKPGDNYSEETNSFSMTNALGNVSDSFKQGYKSKLIFLDKKSFSLPSIISLLISNLIYNTRYTINCLNNIIVSSLLKY